MFLRLRHFHAEKPCPPRVPGYEIISVLANDGGNAIYKARDVRLNWLVALKISRPATGVEQQRLLREARYMASLNQAWPRGFDPGVVTVHMVGEHQGQCYIGMELVEGGPLAEKMGAPWPPRAAAKFLKVLADTVDAVHQRGIIHRRINPSHILLTKDGRPKLTGFRFASVQVETTLPAEHAEKLAADIRGLGTVLYEMLTGQHPFEDDPVPPRRLEPSVPSELETICLKCLAKRPEDRYRTAEGLRDDLRRYMGFA
jgi:serine/threonine protein kinase